MKMILNYVMKYIMERIYHFTLCNMGKISHVQLNASLSNLHTGFLGQHVMKKRNVIIDNISIISC